MLPLKNKTVLITRSANQVEDFINQLQELGANTVTLPLIENTPTELGYLDAVVVSLKLDWIVFTSTVAVKIFFETISPEFISSKIAVVGNKTGNLVRKYGFKVDFTPSEFTAKHLAYEIPIEPNQQILIPRSSLAKNDIVEILTARNCDVEAISIYENTAINYSKEEIEKCLNDLDLLIHNMT